MEDSDNYYFNSSNKSNEEKDEEYNESNESNDSNKSNESNESNESNKSNESNESKEENKSNNSYKKIHKKPTKKEVILDSDIIEEKIIYISLDIHIRKYKVGKIIGEGGFGKCYEFTNTETNKIYAAKVFSKENLENYKYGQKIISEININKDICHPNIVLIRHYFEDANNVYILFDLCQNGNLSDLIKKRKFLTELEVQYYIIQLIKGLKYLHNKKIIHRDLKPRNIFLTDKMKLKIGDFGLAAKLDYEGEKLNSTCGTPSYLAPEIINKQNYSFEIDIWDLGIVIYYLLIGKNPFDSNNVKEVYKKIKTNDYNFPENSNISEVAKDLISQILVLDPNKRPTLDQILSHEFFNLGISIPLFIPNSFLSSPPSLSYIRQFMPDADENGIVHKSFISKKLIDMEITINIKEDYYREVDEFTSCSNDPYEGNPHLKGADVYIIKYDEFSSYRLCYLLNNKFIGIHFYSNEKIILNTEDDNFIFITRDKENKVQIFTYTLDNYPKEILDKIELLKSYKILCQNNNLINKKEKHEKKENIDSLVYVKKWMRHKFGMVFLLSNQCVQMIFIDKTQILLLIKTKIFTYIDKTGKKGNYHFSWANNNPNYEMVKRVMLFKEILKEILKEMIK